MNDRERKIILKAYRVYTRFISKPMYKTLRRLGIPQNIALYVCSFVYMFLICSPVYLFYYHDLTLVINIVLNLLLAYVMVWLQLTLNAANKEI